MNMLAILGVIAVIAVLMYWAFAIINALTKDEPNDKPWSLDDRDEREE